MTLHDELFEDSGAAVLLDQHGEPCVYWPIGASQGRAIIANIDRNPPAPLGEANVIGMNIAITVRNINTSLAVDGYGGIAADEVDTGGDEIEFPLYAGGSQTTRRPIKSRSDQNGRMLTLGVR